ncbi:anti-sigma factor family protein [Roseivivax isoporae]|uniref:Anti-sigma factor n=1 Tax=Roseivivax isoporae LMG 25204 TaxID=1449351 RepID=X7FEA1_9RHOB|nr:hypothetical protein [Roseivivax isoporae]ETX30406.1 hypothetical protein RISW2_12105 [Roseivivax isoporae LMG 25204]
MTEEDDRQDEILMAYADGELPPAEASALEARLAAEPDLAERLRLFTGTRDALSAAAARRAEAPLPEGMEARLRAAMAGAAAGRSTDNVVPLRARAATAPAQGGSAWAPAAIAASLALAVGLAGGFILGVGSGSGPTPPPLTLAALDPGVSDALDTVPSGEDAALEDGRTLAAIASFEDGAGAFCREYEVIAADGRRTVSVACDAGEGWDMRLALDAGREAADGSFVPASSLEVLDAYYATTGAGAPLPSEDEAARLADRDR